MKQKECLVREECIKTYGAVPKEIEKVECEQCKQWQRIRGNY